MELDFVTGIKVGTPNLRLVNKSTGEIKKGDTRNKWGKFKHAGFYALATSAEKLSLIEIRVLFYMMSIVKASGHCFIEQNKVVAKLSSTSGRIAGALKSLVDKDILVRVDAKHFILSNKYFGG